MVVVHFFCTKAADLAQVAVVLGPHFTCEPDGAGAFPGAVDCRGSSGDLDYLRSLPSVTVFPLPRRHGEPLSDSHVSLLTKRYGVKKGDTMTDALGKIYAQHPAHWFNPDNF